ncbi:hypothetical protein T11_18245 [Trichinella zimbabwensis]|uniref:Uncharacterized protein n=1 Tax=Trichinella zimbabwensis TaxID=268475 RepID=A0A0V1HP03_9BILA|nr:hypothetical protein T11_18245 [Trichinella zimbabwensis]
MVDGEDGFVSSPLCLLKSAFFCGLHNWIAVDCIIASAVACVVQVTRVQIPLPSEKYNTPYTLDRSTQNELTRLI